MIKEINKKEISRYLSDADPDNLGRVTAILAEGFGWQLENHWLHWHDRERGNLPVLFSSLVKLRNHLDEVISEMKKNQDPFFTQNKQKEE